MSKRNILLCIWAVFLAALAVYGVYSLRHNRKQRQEMYGPNTP